MIFLEGRNYYHFLADEETEAQRNEIISLVHT